VPIERLVEGPASTGFGIHEAAGRYPLRVEGAADGSTVDPGDVPAAVRASLPDSPLMVPTPATAAS
jgi:hypothetical protein